MVTYEGCEQVVKRMWECSIGDNLTERISCVSHGLEGWSSEKYNDTGKQISKAKEALHKAQQLPISEESCKECTDIEQKLDDLNA